MLQDSGFKYDSAWSFDNDYVILKALKANYNWSGQVNIIVLTVDKGLWYNWKYYNN